MRTAVNVDAVAEHAAGYGFAYLITINSRQRVHTSVVHPRFAQGAVVVPGASERAKGNADAHPDVSLVWPPAEATGYSLIVDGTASGAVDETDGLAIAPTRAILHRPATEPSGPDAGDGCVQDCIEL